MRKRLCLLIIAAFVLFSTNAFADEVIGTGGWQSWMATHLNENGSPYWDGNSFDYSTSGNIGNYLTKTGEFTGGSGPGVAYDYWGNIDGTAGEFSFKWLSGSSTAALRLEVAGYASQNIFGYEDDDGQHVIFNGAATVGAAATFTPTMNYVFYLTSPDGTFTTDMFYEDYEGAYQHFAIFKEREGVYWLGMEDLSRNSDFDYNDMIVKITVVPEPGVLLLLGLGLVGVAAVRRKFKS